MDEKFSFCCSPIFYYFFIGNGSTRPTKNKYDNAPNMHNIPAVAKGTKNEPWVSVSITPVNVVINIPAKLPAKFMMPPIEGATYLSSDGAKGKPLTMQSLNHTPFFQRKMATGCTYVLDYVRMVVIHSDCSFVDDLSQNHFNMKRHYGFLFFD